MTHLKTSRQIEPDDFVYWKDPCAEEWDGVYPCEDGSFGDYVQWVCHGVPEPDTCSIGFKDGSELEAHYHELTIYTEQQIEDYYNS